MVDCFFNQMQDASKLDISFSIMPFYRIALDFGKDICLLQFRLLDHADVNFVLGEQGLQFGQFGFDGVCVPL